MWANARPTYQNTSGSTYRDNIFFKLAEESCVFVCFYAFFPDNLLVFFNVIHK